MIRYLYPPMPLRIALIARSTLYRVPGGDTIQIQQTARLLNASGIKADICLTHEKITYNRYDLLHFFNITRPADILYHINKTPQRFIVSTIHIDYREYDSIYRKGLSGFILRMLPAHGSEYIKTLLRRLKGQDQWKGWQFVWKGQYKTIQEILRRAAIVLPNSYSEYTRLAKTYHLQPAYKVIPNGIDPQLFQYNPQIAKDPNLVICVARIEGIKNQLTLIQALNNTKYKLLLIGSPSPNQQEYYMRCRKAAASNIRFINNLSQQELLQFYQQASIHILPSWFETTGLSSLEAAAMGCKVIITDKGDAKEYFRSLAGYCNPQSPESMYAAIEAAAAQPYDNTLRNKILSNYIWQEATDATVDAYKEVIQSYEATHRHSWHKRYTQ
ncbi:Glycosyltransferase involved in cell wall bisynthesis [Filimonas lacunae]|uniref:Glycosyltransferase involved in cell wall bisynthesis n=1 Tax=Filimonas lacunae TaxID=477680 RepID=A0A173MDA3_9BACT|nr:glycosyltransferase family 4 protein [Filimonas lacunae]BAV05572.1 glycosyl transferase [Filimonas lacunae]SIT29327.1 Glycosyltransferase involved in cell wall bisynthesis [Filimonas lacunae]